MFTEEQNEKLDALDARRNNGDFRRDFSKIVVVKLGVQPRPYFPKLKGSDGKPLKDANGNEKRSEQQRGWMYTFAEYTNCEPLRIILAKEMNLKRGLYVVSGRGYGSDGGSKFIDADSHIANY